MQDGGIPGTKDDAKPVTISTAPAGVTIDPHNPLPEPSFLWRRIIACAIATFALALAGYSAGVFRDHSDMGHLYDLTIRILWGAALVQTYYFVAPSASELTAMIQTASIVKHSLSLAGTADKNATDRAESYAGRRFEGDPAPEGQKTPTPPDGPPGAPSGDLPESDDDDAAPSAKS